MFEKFSLIFDIMIDSGIELPTKVVLPESTFVKYFHDCCVNVSVCDIKLFITPKQIEEFSILHKGKRIHFLSDRTSCKEKES